jgi:hypothetical protein
MVKNNDCYRKLAQGIVAMFEKELGKFDFGDFDSVAEMIRREISSPNADATGWSYDKLTPEEKADYDFMMNM